MYLAKSWEEGSISFLQLVCCGGFFGFFRGAVFLWGFFFVCLWFVFGAFCCFVLVCFGRLVVVLLFGGFLLAWNPFFNVTKLHS